MRNLMPRAALRESAGELLGTIASIPRRRFFWLLLVAVAGYSYGYNDAFRGPESLGWKFSELVDHVMPASVQEMRRKNAEALRQRTQQSIEIPQ